MMATITSPSLLVSALRHRERASSRSGRADSGMSEGGGEGESRRVGEGKARTEGGKVNRQSIYTYQGNKGLA